MNTIITAVKSFVADEDGVTAIEYGLIAALVGLALAVGAKALGGGLSDAFNAIGIKIKNATTGL